MRKIQPGLSSFKNATHTAGSSLDALIRQAKEIVPAEQITETPVFLLATAGLRMMSTNHSGEILASVRQTLSTSGFAFQTDWVYIIKGSDEALFSWVTVNYLLGTLYWGEGGTHGPFTSCRVQQDDVAIRNPQLQARSGCRNAENTESRSQ